MTTTSQPTPAPPAPVKVVEIRSIISLLAGLLIGAMAVIGFVAWQSFRTPKAPPPPPIRLPAEITGFVGRPIIIEGETTGNQILFYPIPGPTVPSLIPRDNKSTTFVTPTPGDYVVIGITEIKDKLSDSGCIVHAKTGPGPGPEPTPTPGPTPPKPGPGPTPNDPFVATLKVAWTGEADPNKVADLAKLQDIYKATAGAAATDTSLKTIADLYVKFRSLIKDLPPDALPKVRDAVSGELKAKLPSSTNAPLDDATRKIIADTFNRIANDLEALKT